MEPIMSLSFYLTMITCQSMSDSVSLGQFMQEPKIHIFNERPGKDPEKPEASMEVKGQKLIVTRGVQKDYRTDLVFGTDVTCWFVHNSGKGFIDGITRITSCLSSIAFSNGLEGL
ncbi:inter-alpha-trypsin inhibitor heavy chain H2-like [Nomascus leucogenys]|uniref:inter-alpha-trypsin inhibitor heavy chain H2-like n=1 Tax=Nomascus leucogenys TaxID=61853 RepID=UPI00122D79EB|nr:inter-alpha-trypsin inhibitor heavy chain H2-like [Nomascus leucogenys]